MARACRFVVIALVLSTLVSACGAARGGVTVWIDAPLSGGQVHPGEEVPVQTHAYASSGVAQIELKVDGLSFSREAPSPAGGDLASLTQTWIATSPGMHTLQVVAYGTEGAASSPVAVRMEVLGEEPAVPPSEPDVLTPGVVPPTITVTPYVPITITVAAPPVINFNADDESLLSGECTFLRWQSQNAISVTLDGSPVGNPDARQVCPQQTTNYVLRAAYAGGERSQSLQIQVSAPPPPPPPQDTAGPVISSVGAQPASIFDSVSCGPDRAQVTGSVTDAGSGVERVDIYYKVVKQQAQSGQWVSQRMNGSEVQGYYFYLGPAELRMSLDLYGGGTVQYYLVAVDSAGNSSQGGNGSFQTQTCIL
jgi:hypothetical protein